MMPIVRIFIMLVLLSVQPLMAIETTIDMVRKADKEINVLKAELDKKCKTFESTLDEKGGDLFKNEQACWLELTAAKAEFAADKYRGGSLSRVIRLRAVIAEYQTRLKQLDSYINEYDKP